MKSSKINKPQKEKVAKIAKLDESLLAKQPKTTPKERPRSRHASKKSKGVGGQSFGDASNSSEDNVAQAVSQTVFEENTPEVFRLKGKKHHSKECEEAVNLTVADFWEAAWNICAERFFIAAAPITVSFELRNTWLGIVEAEWQDLDMRETPAKRPNRIFQRDEPPLPLAFDTWSRGAMELLPRYRRESVLDPFLRDLDAVHDEILTMTEIKSSDEMNDEGEASNDPQEEARNSSNGPDYTGDVDLYGEDQETSPTSDLQGLDHWPVDLEEEEKQKTESSSKSAVTSSQKSSPEELLTPDEKPIITILPPRTASADDSTTDVDSSSHPVVSIKGRRSQFTLYNARKKFSPSQCGGKTGSGVFRLPTETTSEALQRMNNAKADNQESPNTNENSTESQMEADQQSSQKNRNSQAVDDGEFEILPLFEDRTFPGDTQGETLGDTHRFHEIGWKGISYSEGHHNRGPSLDYANPEVDKKFLKRKLANLHNRFTRQTIKFFTSPLKAPAEVTLTQDQPSPPAGSRRSSVSSLKSKSVGSDRKKVSRGSQGTLRENMLSNNNKTTDHLKPPPVVAKGATPSRHAHEHPHTQSQAARGGGMKIFPSRVLNTHGYVHETRFSVGGLKPNVHATHKPAYPQDSVCTTATCKKGTTTSS